MSNDETLGFLVRDLFDKAPVQVLQWLDRINLSQALSEDPLEGGGTGLVTFPVRLLPASV